MNTTSIDDLISIGLNLSFVELQRLCLSNKRLHQLCQSDKFWYRKTLQDFSNSYKPKEISWYQHYMDLEKERQYNQQLEIIEGYKDKMRAAYPKPIYDYMLDLDLNNLNNICNSMANYEMYKICQDEIFWEDKTYTDIRNPIKPSNMRWRDYYIQEYNR